MRAITINSYVITYKMLLSNKANFLKSVCVHTSECECVRVHVCIKYHHAVLRMVI